MPSIEIDLRVPYPTVVLMGCQPNLRPSLGEAPCHVCGGGIRPDHTRHYCAQCDALAPTHEAAIRGAKLGQAALDKSRDAANGLPRKPPELSETTRRRLWNGYKGGIGAALPEDMIGNRARVGREWLAAIGQVPDFDLILDKHGRIIGRYEAEPAA